MDDGQQKIEDFYGVYLLCSQSLEKRYRNRCYIGYTVNPNRRINQHNRGIDFGGARKTNNKGPWTMVMIIHGFPNNISALQFEWAWQSPNKSSRLKMIKDLEKKKRTESHFDYNFRILTEMLRIGPWNRLPLTVRWLASDYVKNFPADKIPPLHMQICHGHVIIKKKSKQQQQQQDDEFELFTNDYVDGSIKSQQKRQQQSSQLTTIMTTQIKSIASTATSQTGCPTLSSSSIQMECHLCMQIIENPKRSKINCINPKCKLTCHIVCLANQFLEPGHYIPIEGDCPICETHFLWGDLIRKKNGCNDLEDYKDDEDYDKNEHNNDEDGTNDNDDDDDDEDEDEDDNNGVFGGDDIMLKDTDYKTYNGDEKYDDDFEFICVSDDDNDHDLAK